MSNLNILWLAENFGHDQTVLFDIGCADLSSGIVKFKSAIPNGIFYAFECADHWKKSNTKISEIYKINYFHLGISDSEQSTTFFPSAETGNNEGWHFSGSFTNPKDRLNQFDWGTPYTANITRLDTFCTKFNVKPDFICIDVEGDEYKILTQLNANISPKALWVRTPYYTDKNSKISFNDLVFLLDNKGYKLHFRGAADALFVQDGFECTAYNPANDDKEIDEKIKLLKYKVIKAEAWPNITSSAEFNLLSEHIKKECKEVFNLEF